MVASSSGERRRRRNTRNTELKSKDWNGLLYLFKLPCKVESSLYFRVRCVKTKQRGGVNLFFEHPHLNANS